MKRKSKKDQEIFSWVVKNQKSEDLLRAQKTIKSLLAYRRLETLHTRYIEGIKKAVVNNQEKKCYFDFKFGSTVTGRLSCARYSAGKNKPKGVSFHTLPRETEFNIRSIFVAPPGYDFIVADLKTMELRMLAHLSQDKEMLNAFRNNVDIHSLTARGIFGRESITKEERQIGKTVNFTVVFGGNEYTISEKNNLPLAKGKEILTRFFSLYGRVFEFFQESEQFIRKNGYIDTIFGRRRHLPNVFSPAKPIQEGAVRQGNNFIVQSPSSDFLLGAAVGSVKEFKKLELDGWFVASVHDSLEGIVRKEFTQQANKIIQNQMVNYPYIKNELGMNFSVPFEVEISVGPSFGIGEEVDLTKLGEIV